MSLPVKRLTDTATLPTRGSADAAGLDLYADEECRIAAGMWRTVSTGIAIAVPPGHYGRVAPRSGLAAKHGLDTFAGVVDCDYRGEVRVVLMNHSASSYTVKRGDRIAQLIVEAIAMPAVVEVATLDGTERGAGGFGSSGA